MKNSIKILLLTLVVIMIGTQVYSDNESDKKTQRTINKAINKEAKRLEKKGYSVEPGAVSMEFQLRRSYQKEFATKGNGAPFYIVGVGSAISDIENAARLHAISDATINACMLLESQIMGLIEQDYNNKLYSRNEFQTLSQMKGVFSNLLAHSLPTGIPVTSFVKDHKHHYEYQVRVAYPMEVLCQNVKEVAREILSKENEELRKKFERITNFENLGK